MTYPRLGTMTIADFSLNQTEINNLARFKFVVIGSYPGWQYQKTAPAMLKAVNPKILVAAYSLMQSIVKDSAHAAITAKLDAAGWWLKTASGAQIVDSYGANSTNPLIETAPDANGQRLPQWIADYFNGAYFSGAAYDVWYFDNMEYVPRDSANWLLDGVNRSGSDATVATQWRSALAAHWAQARKDQPNLLMMGNTDSDLNFPEFASGPLNLCHHEGITTYHPSWSDHMTRYLTTGSHMTAPAMCQWGSYGNAGDYAFFRYNFAAALMGDGLFSYNPGGNYGSAPWMDEYGHELGIALQAAAAGLSSVYAAGAQAGAFSGGVWRRDFANGIALVNPIGNATRTVSLGGTFRKITGTQDPKTNDGSNVTSVTLNAGDGLILLR